MNRWIAGLGILVLLSGCGVRSIPKAYQEVQASLDEVLASHKEQAELIPPYLQRVQSQVKLDAAKVEVIVRARSSAISIPLSSGSGSEQELKKFKQSYDVMVSEFEPIFLETKDHVKLAKDQSFKDLVTIFGVSQARVKASRERYAVAVKKWNELISKFPESLVNRIFFHHESVTDVVSLGD